MNQKKSKTGKGKKAKRLSEAELFAIAAEREEFARQMASAKADKTEADQTLIGQLKMRGVRSIESDKYAGGFTRITLVQPEVVEYDEVGIRGALKPKQRNLCFDRHVNLNALSEEARKKVIDVLSREELAAVTTESLNVDRLAKAVQQGKIDQQVIADHSTIKEISPSIRISHGSGS